MLRCKIFLILAVLIFPLNAWSQGHWPVIINTKQGKITVYAPQPQSFTNNKLSCISAVSVEPTGQDPVFGAVWLDAIVDTDRDKRILTLEKLTVPNIRFSGNFDTTKSAQLRQLIETELPKYRYDISLDNVLAQLDQASGSSDSFKNDPPKIIFEERNTVLVSFDGEPKLSEDKNLGVERVANTPFIVVKQKNDSHYYIYVGGRWFSSAGISGPWSYVRQESSTLKSVAQKINANQKETPISLDSLPQIITSTVPAELIQSNGTPSFAPVAGTNLLYMSNTHDNIFMYISSQMYYVLLSGRWYRSSNLHGNWEYVAPDALPADFAKIPEGSTKDVVLASVPGTQAAKEAVIDANVPQTAKADRKKTTTSVTYNGAPQFEAISGTQLSYAVNTSSTVLKEGNTYFVVDRGIWFTGNSPNGPWTVATERPADIDKVPPSSPVYNTKYVYIYDVTPTDVYVGYTPGYLGCYVAGPTVVYGTGFYYPGWFGGMYYPRPVTWGFGMSYNPWTGFSIGMGVNVGFFHFGIGYNFGTGTAFGGGWFGPPIYRPPFFAPYPHFYGPGPVVINNININNFNNRVYANNNIYNRRNDVVTHDRRPAGPDGGGRVINRGPNRPGYISGETRNPNINGRTRNPNISGQTRNPNIGGQTRRPDLQADRQGNVYQRAQNGQWQQRSGNQWNSNINAGQQREMEHNFQNRERGMQRTENFQRSFQRGNFNRGNFRGGGMPRRR